MGKKILWTVIALVVAGVIVLSVWFFFFRGGEEEVVEEDPRRFFPTENQGSIPGGSGGPNSELIDEITPTISRGEIPTLRQISEDPVSGAVSFERLGTTSETVLNQFNEEVLATTSETIFRYIERGTGHMYETKDSSLTRVRLSNITIPRIYTADFNISGENVLLRYLEETLSTTETFKATLVEDEDNEDSFVLEGQFMPRNILTTTLSPTGDRIAYIVREASSTDPVIGTIGGSSVVISSFDSEQTSVVYQSPLSEWNISWPVENILALETKPHSSTGGYLYHLDLDTGIMSKLLERVPGLTTKTSPAGDEALFSASVGSSFSLNLLDIEEQTFQELDVTTFPEKCVWSRVEEYVVYCGAPAAIPRTSYPESWYKGEVSFNDNIWKINTELGTYEAIYETVDYEHKFDVIHPTLSEQDEYLLFMDKNDLTLWSLDLRS